MSRETRDVGEYEAPLSQASEKLATAESLIRDAAALLMAAHDVIATDEEATEWAGVLADEAHSVAGEVDDLYNDIQRDWLRYEA